MKKNRSIKASYNFLKGQLKSSKNKSENESISACQKIPKWQSKSSRNRRGNRDTVKVQWPITSIRWLPKGQWNYRGKWDTGKTCTFGSQNICSATVFVEKEKTCEILDLSE